MRRYSAVPCHIWQDNRITGHSPECSLVACYLLSNPHTNIIGLYHLPPIYAATETGLSTDVVADSINHLKGTSFCEYSTSSQFVWVRYGMLAELGQSLKSTDNRVGAIRKLLSMLPAVDLVEQFRREFHLAYHLDSEAPSKPLGSQFDAPSATLEPSPVPARAPTPSYSKDSGRQKMAGGRV